MLFHRILSQHAHLAAVDVKQSANRTDRRRLAGAVRANQSEHLALLDAERHIAQRREGAVLS